MSDMLSQDRSTLQDARTAGNVLLMLARVGAVSVEVFLHHGFGVHYIGGQAAGAALLIPMFGALLFPQHNQWPLWISLFLFLVGCSSARAQAKRLRRKYPVASCYNGWPKCLKSSASGKAEDYAKRVREPIVIAIVGIMFYSAFNVPLGAWLIFSACCLVINTRVAEWRVNRILNEMEDAQLMQAEIDQRMRERRAGY